MQEHTIIIARKNYARLLVGEPMILAGKNFGLEKDLTIVFAETPEEAAEQLGIKTFIAKRTALNQLNNPEGATPHQ